MDLRDLIGIAWKRKLTVALVALAALGAAAAIAFSRTKEYQATATIAMTPDPHKGQFFVASDAMATLLSTYAGIVDSSSIKAQAASILGHPLHASVSSSTTAGTGILKISATSTSPSESAAAAQALAQAFQNQIAGKSVLVVQVIDPPKTPTTPVAPRPPLIMASGLILGLGLGIALAIILERWFDRLESADEITEKFGLPTLGHLPRERALRGDRPTLVWESADLLRLQEAFRALRTNLQFSMSPDQNVVLVTSPSAGDGKSTVAANLAIALASAGTPTLLVDADFRAPRQHAIFDLPNDEGLSNAMTYGERVPLPIQSTLFKNLSVMTTGAALPSPTEVIASRIDATMARLRETGSLVVIDSPPVLPVSDARLVASQADCVLLVAAAGRTRASALRQTLEHLRLAHAQVVGTALNQVRERLPGYADYGSHYYRSKQPVDIVSRP